MPRARKRLGKIDAYLLKELVDVLKPTAVPGSALATLIAELDRLNPVADWNEMVSPDGTVRSLSDLEKEFPGLIESLKVSHNDRAVATAVGTGSINVVKWARRLAREYGSSELSPKAELEVNRILKDNSQLVESMSPTELWRHTGLAQEFWDKHKERLGLITNGEVNEVQIVLGLELKEKGLTLAEIARIIGTHLTQAISIFGQHDE